MKNLNNKSVGGNKSVGRNVGEYLIKLKEGLLFHIFSNVFWNIFDM